MFVMVFVEHILCGGNCIQRQNNTGMIGVSLSKSVSKVRINRKTKVGVQLVRSFSRLTRDRKEWATKRFVLPKLKISESTKVFLGSF